MYVIQVKRRKSRLLGYTILSVSIFMIVVVLLSILLTERPQATIVGSVHDFSGLNEDQQICIFCHTAHNADTSVTDAPLWNHAVTTQNYQLYNSPSMDAVAQQPTGASRLCLSCHDGTIAVDSYGGRTGRLYLRDRLAIGADGLANDHPVSFTYDDSLAVKDGELFSPSSTPSGLGSSIKKDLLYGDQMQCSSCHDVHNGPAAAAVNDNLLKITQVQSRLCLTCHNK